MPDDQVPVEQLEEEVGPPPEDPVKEVETQKSWVRELMRSYITLALIVLLGLTIIWGFIKSGTDDWDKTKDLLQLIFPAEVSLLGSAVGFYFGTRQRRH